jgi:hypothetical protein
MHLRQGYGYVLASRQGYAFTTRELTRFIGSKRARIRQSYAFNAAKLWLESHAPICLVPKGGLTWIGPCDIMGTHTLPVCADRGLLTRNLTGSNNARLCSDCNPVPEEPANAERRLPATAQIPPTHGSAVTVTSPRNQSLGFSSRGLDHVTQSVFVYLPPESEAHLLQRFLLSPRCDAVLCPAYYGSHHHSSR